MEYTLSENEAFTINRGTNQVEVPLSASGVVATTAFVQEEISKAKNYKINTAVATLSSGSYVYSVEDRAMTTIGINQSSTPVVINLPDAGNGARDFILRIEISSSAAPTFTFTNASGLEFDTEDDDWAVMEPGLNIVSFTETKR